MGIEKLEYVDLESVLEKLGLGSSTDDFIDGLD